VTGIPLIYRQKSYTRLRKVPSPVSPKPSIDSR